MYRIVIIFILLSINATAFADELKTLCNESEYVAFNCISSSKILSLCGTKDFDKRGGKLQYRYGVKGNIELSYPKLMSESEGAFFSSSTMYSGGGESRVRFRNGMWDYIIFDRVVRTRFDGEGNEPEFTAGLVIKKNEKQVAVKYCEDYKPISHDSLNFMLKENFDYEINP